ncbi:hypothetical protein NVP1244A_185 [Vibrio phage 1.244.A._10N.261.54.C3]|nr:hypothetical protein NVP1244A_185 [Vibrio phage 1.244.A._10N.261.54.C3]AUR98813.1 hypothetical protein NVP1255O_185 [Vibrio phage 1.255.O._10N.286.45.F1]
MNINGVGSFPPYEIQQAADDASNKSTSPLAAASWLADMSSPDFTTEGEVKYNLEATQYSVKFTDKFGDGVVTFSMSEDGIFAHTTWDMDQDG